MSVFRHWFGRRRPKLAADGPDPVREISFVVVRFSDEYDHNLAESPCVSRALNELVVVENTGNAYFENLACALNAGLARARHELIVVVHEDVYLPLGWQRRFEEVLRALEDEEANWGLVGSVGVDGDGATVGHASNPFHYRNTYRRGERFTEVFGLDEQLLVLRREDGGRFDEGIPGIHGLGMDLALQVQAAARRCFVVDAPLIHKHRDAHGRPIRRPDDSSKIKARGSLTFLSEREACGGYLRRKWAAQTPFQAPAGTYKSWVDPRERLAQIESAVKFDLDRPVVLLAKGGGGSRLLSTMARDCGVDLGPTNRSGDSKDMIQPVYQGLLEKYGGNDGWNREVVVSRLRLAAAEMLLRQGQSPGQTGGWGFKLPESLLILPEIGLAFPQARYVHLVRDPLSTALRRTHMTARLDNAVGRTTLPLAYRAAARSPESLLSDSEVLHMAHTTKHQLELALDWGEILTPDRYLELPFEAVVSTPAKVVDSLAEWLGVTPVSRLVEAEVDPQRASGGASDASTRELREARAVLRPVIERLGYSRARR